MFETYESFAESVLEYTSNDRLAPRLLSVLTTAGAGLVPEEILEAPSVPEFGCPVRSHLTGRLFVVSRL